MRAIELSEYNGPLQVIDRPLVEPGPGQIRVRIAAASINPIDRFLASGAFATVLPHIPLPYTLGFDVAGIVDAVGDGAPFRTGQRVAAMVDWFQGGLGTFADTVILEQGWVVPVPEPVDLAEAATIPLNGLTAQQSLALLNLKASDQVLITGASGAVGGFAVQLAVAAGVKVVAVASFGDEDRVRELGASHVISRDSDLVAETRRIAVDGVDAAFDAAPVGPQLIGAVRDGGAFVTVLDQTLPEAQRGIRVAKVTVGMDNQGLQHLFREHAAGRLRTSVADRVPLNDADKAFKLASQPGLRGKIVLIP